MASCHSMSLKLVMLMNKSKDLLYKAVPIVNNVVLCALKLIENRPCIKRCYHKIRITTTKGQKETRKC